MKNNIKLWLIGIFTGILNGFFGSGGGSFLVPILKNFEITEQKSAHATSVAVIMMMSVVSAFFYLKGGVLDFNITLWVGIGGALGGIIGAVFLKKLSGNVISKIFGVFLIIASVRFIFK